MEYCDIYVKFKNVLCHTVGIKKIQESVYDASENKKLTLKVSVRANF